MGLIDRHALLLPLTGLSVGIMVAADRWQMATLVVFVSAFFLLLPRGRTRSAPRGVQRALLRAVAGLLLSSLAGYGSARIQFATETAFLDGAYTVCVGSMERYILEGHCLLEREQGHSWEPGRVRVVGIEPAASRMVVHGRLALPGARRNPGDPDRGFQDRIAGVSYTLVADGYPRKVLSRPGWQVRVAARLSLHHDKAFRGLAHSGLVRAMTLGDRGGLDPVIRRSFSEAGVSHLLAISGYHIGVIALVVHLLTGIFLERLGLVARVLFPLRYGLTVILVAAYAGTVGGSAATTRAALMGFLLLGRPMLGRCGHDSLHALLVVALIYLTIVPSGLFSVGFLLSFSAVYGIIRDGRKGGPLAVSFCAALFTLPVATTFFGFVAPAGVIVNLVAIPVAGGIVTCMALVHFGLFIPAFPALLISWPAGVASALSDLLVRLAQGAATLPGMAVTTATGLLFASILLLSRVPNRASGRRVVALFSISILLAVLTIPGRRPVSLTFLDVGHGDAMVLRSSTGRILLVDAGSPGKGYVVGRHLRHIGVDRVNYAVITHSDQDHLGGVRRALSEVRVDTIVSGHSVLSQVKEMVGPHWSRPFFRGVASGANLDLDDDLDVRVLAPSSSDGDSNNNSIVLSIIHGRNRILLLGDAESSAEAALVSVWDSALASDLVKVGHHGSRTSSRSFLVRRAAAQGKGWAIVSVDSNGRFGLPSEQVLANWRQAGMRVLTTGQSGAVTCLSDGVAIRCSPHIE